MNSHSFAASPANREPLRAIVLAAQRQGALDPLAARFGTTHKCLIPLHGRPLIAYVLETLGSSAHVGEIVVSVEEEQFPEIAAIAAHLGLAGQVRPVAAQSNIADSVIAAAEDHDGPFLITTADNALLTERSVAAMARALDRCDAAMALAQEESVRAAHPEGQRRFYGFRDGGYSNCNLYGIGSRKALSAAEIFRGGGQFAKKARRIVDAFGLVNLLMLRARLVSLDGGLQRISRRIGHRIVPVVLPDGSQAIDVDNDRTYDVVAELLEPRLHARQHAPLHAMHPPRRAA